MSWSLGKAMIWSRGGTDVEDDPYEEEMEYFNLHDEM